MSTEMHLQIQRLTPYGWQNADTSAAPQDVQEMLSAPNYRIMAAIAGVRNSFGVPSIAPGRGWPADLPAFPYTEDEVVFGPGHVTLDELLSYDWHGPAWQQEVVSFGDPYPLTHFTEGWRRSVLPYLESLRGPVRLVYFFSN